MANVKGTFEKFKKSQGMNNGEFAKCCHNAGIVAKPGDKKKPQTKKITMAEVDNSFMKAKKNVKERTITFEEFKEAVRILNEKEGDKDKVWELIAAANPSLTGVTKISKTGGVDKMTDTSQYTGSHKQRFNEDGVGKGMEGRADIVENTGYTGGYKGQNTYDSK